jgi:hypothetical protein
VSEKKMSGFKKIGRHKSIFPKIFACVCFAVIFGIISRYAGIGILRDVLEPQGKFMDKTAINIFFLIIPAVVAFFALFWKRVIFIILFCLVAVFAGIVGVTNTLSNEGRYLPSSISSFLIPKGTDLQHYNAMKALPALAKTNDDVHFWYSNNTQADTQAGTIKRGSIIELLPIDKSLGEHQKFAYRGRQVFFNISLTTMFGDFYSDLRWDRTARLSEIGYLLDRWAYDTNIIKEIPKGQIVTLTGSSSNDGLAVEVIYNDTKGWLASGNINFNY